MTHLLIIIPANTEPSERARMYKTHYEAKGWKVTITTADNIPHGSEIDAVLIEEAITVDGFSEHFGDFSE